MLNQKLTIPTTFRRMEREREERDANFLTEPTFFLLGDTHRRSILLCRFKRRTDHLHVNHRLIWGLYYCGAILLFREYRLGELNGPITGGRLCTCFFGSVNREINAEKK